MDTNRATTKIGTVNNKKNLYILIILALILIITSLGALLSMLEISELDVAGLSLQPSSMLSGLKLILNRFFFLSENYQAYEYTFFDVSAPPHLSGGLILTAFIPIALVIIVYVVISLIRRSPLMYLLSLSLFFGIAIYFGVFPSPFWTILLSSAHILTAIYVSDRAGWAPGRYIWILVSLCLVLFTLLFTYTGPNSKLDTLSEQIRDLFDEKVEQPISSLFTPPQSSSQTEIIREQMQQNNVGLDPPGDGKTHEMDMTESFSGSQIGTAFAGRIWILWLFLGLFGASLTIWALFKYISYKKSIKFSSMDDISKAVNAMFLHLMCWLEEFGLESGLPYPEYTNQLRELVSDSYAEKYKSAVALWQEAAFSSHELTSLHRTEMEAHMNHTISEIKDRSASLKVLSINLHIIFKRRTKK